MLPPRPLRLLLALATFALTLPEVAFGQDRRSRKARQNVETKAADKADALPELISTEGETPKWKNQRELEAAAAKGDAQACMQVAQQLLDKTPPDHVGARPWLVKAASGGVANAFFRLGKMHHDGLGVPTDRTKAFEHYLEAAKRGVPEAQYNVGAQLASGRGVRRNFVEGLAWLIVATKSGAAADGEKLLRERLKSRPADIAAGEKRAAAIQEALAKGEPIDAKASVAPAARRTGPSAAGAKLPDPPKVERPTFVPEKPDAPKIEMPVAPLPPTALPGKP